MSATTDAVVTLQRLEGHIALVTLNRPEARNAVNGALAMALEAAVDETEADDDIWTVVLASSGTGVFCAGADLKEVSAGRGSTLATARGGFAGFVFRERAKPWIAAVDGKALAGGCEIVLACDLLVATAASAFGLPEVSRGLIAAAGGMYRLPRALPPQLALELIITTDTIDATRAHALGWVNRLAAAGKAVDEAVALAQRVNRNAPVAVRQSLRVARRANELDDAALRALTQEARNIAFATEDFKEGPRAFIEKRAPRWTGR